MSSVGSSANSGGTIRNGAPTTRWRSRGIASSARCSVARKRSSVGRRSRKVRLQKSERSAGSFSTAHMIASAFDIRTGQRYVVAAPGRRQGVAVVLIPRASSPGFLLPAVLVESGGLARLMVAFGEVGCVASRVGVQAGRELEIAVLLVQVRGDGFAPRYVVRRRRPVPPVPRVRRRPRRLRPHGSAGRSGCRRTAGARRTTRRSGPSRSPRHAARRHGARRSRPAPGTRRADRAPGLRARCRFPRR